MSHPESRRIPQAPGRISESSGSHPALPRAESRRHLRFKIDEADANLSLKGFLTSLGLGRANKARAAINLSEGGVMLLVRELLPEGAKVMVRIEMEKYSEVIEAPGEVRWCEQSARNEKDYYAGIQFTGLGPADLKKIGQMRDWFTSAEYKTRSATRRRTPPPPLTLNA